VGLPGGVAARGGHDVVGAFFPLRVELSGRLFVLEYVDVYLLHQSATAGRACARLSRSRGQARAAGGGLAPALHLRGCQRRDADVRAGVQAQQSEYPRGCGAAA
jgi:hypothetical protein